MNPFENSKFLKNIKKSFVIRNMINENNEKLKISECVFKEKNDVIYMSIKYMEIIIPTNIIISQNNYRSLITLNIIKNREI
jgi:hypothetical protein